MAPIYIMLAVYKAMMAMPFEMAPGDDPTNICGGAGQSFYSGNHPLSLSPGDVGVAMKLANHTLEVYIRKKSLLHNPPHCETTPQFYNSSKIHKGAGSFNK